MTASDIRIDLMELADIGQPTKLALELHRQIRAQLGSVPHRAPLMEIARAVGITAVEEFDTDRFEGTLVVQGEAGAIGLRRGLNPGRRNFTLGHELGHFLNPWHRSAGLLFECDKRAIAAQRDAGFAVKPRAERIEFEANEFAAALLLPMPEFRAARAGLGREVDVGHIRVLAGMFAVSQEFMARRYVDQAGGRLAVLHSHEGIIRSFALSRDFPWMGLRRGAPLPFQCRTRFVAGLRDPGHCSPLEEVPTETWLERRGTATALFEQVLVQRQGWATTLLLVEEEEPGQDDDDGGWNRRR